MKILIIILGLIFNLNTYSQSKVKKTVNISSNFITTQYCLQGKTASGKPVGNGVVAADLRIFKLGTKLLIDGKVYYVWDSGKFIIGNRIDIYNFSCKLAKIYGKKKSTVSVI